MSVQSLLTLLPPINAFATLDSDSWAIVAVSLDMIQGRLAYGIEARPIPNLLMFQ